ncbi:MAG: cytochrome c3 family protein, partial [Bacteroidota bacterium]
TDTWNGTGEICIVCHTPHNALTSNVLWNHEESAATFTLYPATGTMNSTPGQPTGTSLLCLSCHDGTVALEDFGGVTTGTNHVTGGDLVGTDISDDHPISLTYDAALATADGSLWDPTATASGLGGNIDADMLFGPTNNQLECSSCHDVHNNGLGTVFLLRKDNAASALCLTCHNK